MGKDNPQNQISQEIIDNIYSMYISGSSINDIINSLGMRKVSIVNILIKKGINKRNTITDNDKIIINNMHKEGKNRKEISKLTEICYSTVAHIIKSKNNVNYKEKLTFKKYLIKFHNGNIPLCSTENEFNSWGDAAIKSQQNTRNEQTINFCSDCTKKYQSEMIKKNTCDYPDRIIKD